MADFVFSGGCRWNDLCAVDVKVGADGTPISCKNPITGAEISGGGGPVTIAEVAVTVTGAEEAPLNSTIYVLDEDAGISSYEALETGTYQLQLLNGSWDIVLNEGDVVAVTGDASYNAGTSTITVSGDCTINVTPAE